MVAAEATGSLKLEPTSLLLSATLTDPSRNYSRVRGRAGQTGRFTAFPQTESD